MAGLPGYYLAATYFVEVPKEDFEQFAIRLFVHLNEARGVGYALGTSNMTMINSDGECGDDVALEAYLTEYVNGNQFFAL